MVAAFSHFRETFQQKIFSSFNIYIYTYIYIYIYIYIYLYLNNKCFRIILWDILPDEIYAETRAKSHICESFSKIRKRKFPSEHYETATLWQRISPAFESHSFTFLGKKCIVLIGAIISENYLGRKNSLTCQIRVLWNLQNGYEFPNRFLWMLDECTRQHDI